MKEIAPRVPSTLLDLPVITDLWKSKTLCGYFTPFNYSGSYEHESTCDGVRIGGSMISQRTSYSGKFS